MPRRPRYLALTALAASFSAFTCSSRMGRYPSLTGAALGMSMISRSVAFASAGAGAGAGAGATPLPTLSQHPSPSPSISFLDANTAQNIDIELMSDAGGFQLEQLMELAGLSVASAAQVHMEYKLAPLV